MVIKYFRKLLSIDIDDGFLLRSVIGGSALAVVSFKLGLLIVPVIMIVFYFYFLKRNVVFNGGKLCAEKKLI